MKLETQQHLIYSTKKWKKEKNFFETFFLCSEHWDVYMYFSDVIRKSSWNHVKQIKRELFLYNFLFNDFLDTVKSIQVLLFWISKMFLLEGRISVSKTLAVPKKFHFKLLTVIPNSLMEELPDIYMTVLISRNYSKNITTQFWKGWTKTFWYIFKNYKLTMFFLFSVKVPKSFADTLLQRSLCINPSILTLLKPFDMSRKNLWHLKIVFE